MGITFPLIPVFCNRSALGGLSVLSFMPEHLNSGLQRANQTVEQGRIANFYKGGDENAFIMPFINLLSDDVFNPLEVTPKMVCNVGSRKGARRLATPLFGTANRQS
ncbi:MAG: hypothetical protein LBH06_04915 [Rikenellaceae bacterium]|jgi:hypothetical protein|nr:hypothetical protein [Rikenellaceae bacterium]